MYLQSLQSVPFPLLENQSPLSPINAMISLEQWSATFCCVLPDTNLGFVGHIASTLQPLNFALEVCKKP